jgi:hypothetical protein
LPFSLLQKGRQRIEAQAPEFLVVGEPAHGGLKRGCFEAADHLTAGPDPAQQFCLLEHVEMLADRRKRYAKRGRDLANAQSGLRREFRQNGAPGRIGQRGKRDVEVWRHNI